MSLHIRLTFILTLIAAFLMSFLAVSNAQEVATIQFDPQVAELKNGDELTVRISLNDALPASNATFTLLPGPGIDIVSFNEEAADVLAINKNIIEGIATLDIARTTETPFANGEVLAEFTFVLNGENNSVVQIAAGSQIGDQILAESSLPIVALNSEGKVINDQLVNSIAEASEIVIDSEDEGSDVFGDIADSTSLDRNLVVILVFGIPAIVMILIAYMVLVRRNKVAKNNANGATVTSPVSGVPSQNRTVPQPPAPSQPIG
jgi:preprotein translocase subunit YajC